MKSALQEILDGSVEEKIEAAEAIWNSIDESSVPVTGEEIEMAKERYNLYQQNPDAIISWQAAREKLMAKYDL